ncbi:unnamed protein product [Rhizoctonia solani]|uniref:ABC transporter domain-containing protein n=1 Tax=Rhizoctonia solani TaxID=456999 RepID=A0A8H2X125_9AGAM|nr:unnamed protein product [Rhizoctonia solani]
MTIELNVVVFKHPSTSKEVIKDISFKIDSGQLCMIVGRNGSGESTTTSLIRGLYGIDPGNILLEGRSVRDYNVSSLQSAANIMYQDYHHLSLTIRDKTQLGRPECDHPAQQVEAGAKLGGAYDFIQKLPLKFETNIEPMETGFTSRGGKAITPTNTNLFLIWRSRPTSVVGNGRDLQ